MQITREMLVNQLEISRADCEQHKANALAAQGAAQLCEHLIGLMDQEEALNMDQLKEMVGAKEIGEPEPLNG